KGPKGHQRLQGQQGHEEQRRKRSFLVPAVPEVPAVPVLFFLPLGRLLLMSVALIADAHLSGPGGPAGPLVEQLRALPGQGCRRLVLMGDLFQAWVGFRSFETEDVRAVVAALRDLRAQGVEVEYVEGNRDFFLAGSPYADAFDRVALEASFEVGGV